MARFSAGTFGAVLRKHRIAIHGIEAGVGLIDTHRKVVGNVFLDQHKRIAANERRNIVTRPAPVRFDEQVLVAAQAHKGDRTGLLARIGDEQNRQLPGRGRKFVAGQRHGIGLRRVGE